MEQIKIYQNYRKVNWNNIQNIPDFSQKYINVESSPYLYTGTIVSFTNNSITVNETLNENEWVNKVLKFYYNHTTCCFAIVSSNTTNTFYFDSDLISEPLVGEKYDIIDTLVLTEDDLDSIISLNINQGDLGIILPKVSSNINRKYFNIYVEKNDDDINQAAIMSKGTDTQLGYKYGELYAEREGVSLYSHSWNYDHWDVINTQSILRYGNGYWSADEAIANNIDYNKIANYNFFEVDKGNRFIRRIGADGISYIIYRSLFERDFFINCNLTIRKTSTQDDDIIINAHINHPDGTTTDIVNRYGYTYFGVKEGVQGINFKIPITLNFRDEMYLTAKHNIADINFTILQGSTLDIHEIN